MLKKKKKRKREILYEARSPVKKTEFQLSIKMRTVVVKRNTHF